MELLRQAAKYQWQVDTADHSDQIRALQAAGLHYSKEFLSLCLNRGLNTVEVIQDALNQQPQIYHDPFLLYDMDRAVERIQQAVEDQDHIVIYGDYDADGVTSTLILYESLEMIGANVSYYLPNRETDGYGPNLERYKQLIEERDAKVILTCDNGIVGYEAIDYAKEQGVDVIVSDHHEIQETLPNAYAIVHPAHPDGEYPFDDLAGAGVALKIATALLEEVPAEALELAAIGTIADLVSLTDENRTIVLSGLRLMQETPRIGLRLLLERNKVNMSQIDEETVGFVIAPRLNAVGRLADPTPALELLHAYDEEEAERALDYIEDINQERRALVDQMSQEVMARIEAMDELPDVIIEADPGWPAGVLGIAASRVTDRFNRPALLFQYDAQKKEYRGSGRSVDGVDLFQWIYQNKDLTSRFGGHSQAAGLTISQDQWEAFIQAMQESGRHYHDIMNKPSTIKVDLSVSPSDVNLDLIKEISLLAPFGTGNPKPLVLLDHCQLNDFRLIGGDKTHVKLSISQIGEAGGSLDVVGFSMADQCQAINGVHQVSCVGSLSLNEWNGRVTPQLMLKDIGFDSHLSQEGHSPNNQATPKTQWFDERAHPLNPILYRHQHALYLVTHQSLKQYCSERMDQTSQVVMYKEIGKVNVGDFERLVIVEPPVRLSDLKQVVQAGNFKEVYLLSYIQESKYQVGLPTRKEAGAVYRWTIQRPSFHIRTHLKDLSAQLNLPESKIKQIFLMFYEAEFVKISDGYVEVNDHKQNQTVNLEQLTAYINYQEAMMAEQLLNYQPLDQIQRELEG